MKLYYTTRHDKHGYALQFVVTKIDSAFLILFLLIKIGAVDKMYNGKLLSYFQEFDFKLIEQ